ncbi:hypothetical protein PMAYCL1PPCAC_26345, partial [Pristionchus mayeri]
RSSESTSNIPSSSRTSMQPTLTVPQFVLPSFGEEFKDETSMTEAPKIGLTAQVEANCNAQLAQLASGQNDAGQSGSNGPITSIAGIQAATLIPMALDQPKNEADKRFKCSVCSYSTNNKGTLKQHFCTHTGERRFVCSTCAATFTQGWVLRSHIQKVHKLPPFECGSCNERFDKSEELRAHLTEKLHARKRF